MPYPILLLGSQIAVGGAQQVLRTQAGWLHARGYQVTAAFLYDQEGLAEAWQANSPYTLVNLGAWRKGGNPIANLLRLARGLARLLTLLRWGRFQVIETFTPHSNLIGIPLAWLAGVPVRVATHHGRVGNATRWLDALHGRLVNSRLADCLVAVSPQASQSAQEFEGVRPERIVLIPNGVELPAPASPKNRQRVRAGLGIPDSACLILTVGRLIPQKGQAHLLAAAHSVLPQFPRAVFAIAGDGPLAGELARQAAHLRLGDSLRLLGSRTDIPDLLQAADLFVLPSLSEGLPVALLEAMAHGLPVVASRLPGIEAVVDTPETGVLVSPGDPHALAEGILSLLRDESRRAAMARAGQERVRAHFTSEAMCQAYERLFQKFGSSGLTRTGRAKSS